MKKLLSGILTSLLLAACSSNPNQLKNQLNTIGKPGAVEISELKKVRDLNSESVTVAWNFNVTDDKPQQVYWRCDFFDANGLRVGEPERYQEATIYPDEATEASCKYDAKLVTDFKISIQNIATNIIIYH